MKLKIYGGCVSRDIVNFDIDNFLKVVSYNARSSIATLGPENVSKELPHSYYEQLNKIESNFQRQMVIQDFDNSILESIRRDDFDIILIDLMVERLNLVEVNGKFITESLEFNKSGITFDRKVDTFSDEYMELWYQGIDNLFKTVSESVGLDKIKINKVFWANKATDLESTMYINKKWDIQKHNNKLSKMYNYIESILPKHCILKFPEDYLIADPKHRWGLSPFHYVDKYYLEALSQLKNLNF